MLNVIGYKWFQLRQQNVISFERSPKTDESGSGQKRTTYFSSYVFPS